MKSKTPLLLIFLTVFIDLLGFGILIPILPTFATKILYIDETAIGIVLAAYSLTQFLFNPFFGKWSDKYGRKPVIVICLLLNSIGYIIFAFTHSYLMLLTSRIVAGLGGSSIGVAQAYIADVTTKKDRSKGMGLIGSAFGLGFVFGPLMGGFLAKLGYAATGFASAGFSFLAFVLTLILLPESNVNRAADHASRRKLIDIAAYKTIFRTPNLGIFIILFFILTFSIANIYGTFALLGFKIYRFTDLQNGYMYGIIGIVSAAVQGWLLRYIMKLMDEKKMITVGSFCMMTGLALMPYGGSFVLLAVIVTILSIGTGILQPTILSLISSVASEKEQGMTLGINQSLSAFARMLGPLWGGFAFEFLGYPFPFLTGAAFTFLIFLVSLFYLSKKLSSESKGISEPSSAE